MPLPLPAFFSSCRALLISYVLSLTPFFSFFFLMIRRPPRSTLFPYRRSSDLFEEWELDHTVLLPTRSELYFLRPDRKSTRLNSSHRCISYAVFCLKKKKSTTPKNTTCITASSRAL